MPKVKAFHDKQIRAGVVGDYLTIEQLEQLIAGARARGAADDAPVRFNVKMKGGTLGRGSNVGEIFFCKSLTEVDQPTSFTVHDMDANGEV